MKSNRLESFIEASSNVDELILAAETAGGNWEASLAVGLFQLLSISIEYLYQIEWPKVPERRNVNLLLASTWRPCQPDVLWFTIVIKGLASIAFIKLNSTDWLTVELDDPQCHLRIWRQFEMVVEWPHLAQLTFGCFIILEGRSIARIAQESRDDVNNEALNKRCLSATFNNKFRTKNSLESSHRP